MDELDLTQFMGETTPNDLCEIRQHPNSKLIKIEDCRDITSGGTITFFYHCPDCDCEWDVVWHSTRSISVANTLRTNNIFFVK